MKLILLVEDEPDLADTLTDGLEAQGYRANHAACAEDAMAELAARNYDAVIVDWMLPGMNGPDFIRWMRDEGRPEAALMLTVRDSVPDRVQGLDSGADDYLTKPFSFEEMLARLRALLRRPTEWRTLRTVTVGALTINTALRTCSLGDKALDLRKKEFDLLRLMAERSPGVVSRSAIAERVWGSDFVSDSSIHVTISGLRKQLEAARTQDARLRLETVRGIGYRLHWAESPRAESPPA